MQHICCFGCLLVFPKETISKPGVWAIEATLSLLKLYRTHVIIRLLLGYYLVIQLPISNKIMTTSAAKKCVKLFWHTPMPCINRKYKFPKNFLSRRGRLRTRTRSSKSPLKGDFIAGGDACAPGRFNANLNLGGVAIEKNSKIWIIQKKAVSLPRFCRI